MFLRALIILAASVLLLVIKADAFRLLAQIGGGLLLLLGLTAILSSLRRESLTLDSYLPSALGLATAVFGIVLLVRPIPFVDAITYILATVLLLAGVLQLYTRWQMHRLGILVNGFTYVFPLLTFASGLLGVLQPAWLQNFLILTLGLGGLSYALLELVSAWQLWRYKKAQARAALATETAEEEADEPSEVDPETEEIIERAQQEAEMGVQNEPAEEEAEVVEILEGEEDVEEVEVEEIIPRNRRSDEELL